MYCSMILGSDKTTVSVMTGNIEYHPLYLSLANPHNKAWHGHRNGVIPIAFLAIPKCMLSLDLVIHVLLTILSLADRKYDNDYTFCKFKRQLYHSSISAILESLQEGMTALVLCRCPDGHYRHVIYDIRSFIADYPEQVMLVGVVQGWCPRYVHSLSMRL